MKTSLISLIYFEISKSLRRVGPHKLSHFDTPFRNVFFELLSFYLIAKKFSTIPDPVTSDNLEFEEEEDEQESPTRIELLPRQFLSRHFGPLLAEATSSHQTASNANENNLKLRSNVHDPKDGKQGRQKFVKKVQIHFSKDFPINNFL